MKDRPFFCDLDHNKKPGAGPGSSVVGGVPSVGNLGSRGPAAVPEYFTGQGQGQGA